MSAKAAAAQLCSLAGLRKSELCSTGELIKGSKVEASAALILSEAAPESRHYDFMQAKHLHQKTPFNINIS